MIWNLNQWSESDSISLVLELEKRRRGGEKRREEEKRGEEKRRMRGCSPQLLEPPGVGDQIETFLT